MPLKCTFYQVLQGVSMIKVARKTHKQKSQDIPGSVNTDLKELARVREPSGSGHPCPVLLRGSLRCSGLRTEFTPGRSQQEQIPLSSGPNAEKRQQYRKVKQHLKRTGFRGLGVPSGPQSLPWEQEVNVSRTLLGVNCITHNAHHIGTHTPHSK